MKLIGVIDNAGNISSPFSGTFFTHGSGYFTVATNYNAVAKCAIHTDGKIRCWGANNNGRVGDGTTQERTSPVLINTNEEFYDVVTTLDYTCALSVNNKVWCWGRNLLGALGDGTFIDRLSPVMIDTTENYKKVVTNGGYRTCGLTETNKIKCWGRNSNGQIGNGTNNQSSYPNVLSPLLIDSATTYKDIRTFSGLTCGVTSNDDLKCWGGYAGAGSSQNQVFPVIIDSGTKYSTSPSSDTLGFRCAITIEKKLKCWGSGTSFVGDGSTTDRGYPVLIAD
jgi:hypothetical protein